MTTNDDKGPYRVPAWVSEPTSKTRREYIAMTPEQRAWVGANQPETRHHYPDQQEARRLFGAGPWSGEVGRIMTVITPSEMTELMSKDGAHGPNEEARTSLFGPQMSLSAEAPANDSALIDALDRVERR